MYRIIFTAITLFLFIQSFSQVDSMKMKTGPFNIQARDAELITILLINQEIFDDFFDDVAKQFRVANQPTGNTIIRVDSVKVGTLVLLSGALRGLPYSTSKQLYSRIDGAIRACTNSYLQNQLNLMDKREDDIHTQARQRGKKTCKGNLE